MGVSGFFSSCATCRADSRKASSRSAAMADSRPRSRSAAIARMRSRNTPNSGAPRCVTRSGSGSPLVIASVQPTSSSSGRLSCRLRWPAMREARYVRNARRMSPTASSAGPVCRARYSNRRACVTELASSCSWRVSAAFASSDAGASSASRTARDPDAATLSQAAAPLIRGSTRLVAPPHATVRTSDGTSAKRARMTKRRARNPSGTLSWTGRGTGEFH